MVPDLVIFRLLYAQAFHRLVVDPAYLDSPKLFRDGREEEEQKKKLPKQWKKPCIFLDY
jgi:hypothetical protein